MKKLNSLLLLSAAAIVMGSCGNKGQQQAVEVEADSTVVVNVNRDSTLYGICGDGSAMNTLQLITDVGDTLTLSIAEANEKGKCFGGFQAGDRMAVMLKDKTTAKMVINQSAMFFLASCTV